MVLLSGEPGIGKSRLIAALEERLRGEPHESLRYFCSPHHQDSALYPIVTRWERDLGFARGDTPQERLRKLEVALTRVGASPEDVALIADLLSVPVDDRYPAPGTQPAAQEGEDIRGVAPRADQPRPTAAGADAVRRCPLGGCQFA